MPATAPRPKGCAVETLRFTALADAARLDRFLSDSCSDITRSRLRQLILEGNVTLDGSAAKPASRLRTGQVVVVTVPDPVPSELTPQDIPLDVVYEDADLLVVNKPAGLTVHPAPGHPDGTLVNAVLALCPDLQGIGGTLRPGIVHRLDKNTSGLMVVAKSGQAHAALAGQLKRRRVTKRYLALVHGSPERAEALIDAPIGRHPKNRKKMAIVAGGREASTRYKVVKSYAKHTLVEAAPVTGRTHQIRVHLASIGHPLVGDEVYGRAELGLARHFLHAAVLGFRLPSNDEYAEFDSALPDDLQRFLEGLEGSDRG